QRGMLWEVFAELEKFYARQLNLRRDFVARITWPVIQFFLAVFVLAGLIYVLGIIAGRQGPGTKPFDPLGLGLSGEAGALTFLGVIFGSLAALAGGFFLVHAGVRQGVRDGFFFWLLCVW